MNDECHSTPPIITDLVHVQNANGIFTADFHNVHIQNHRKHSCSERVNWRHWQNRYSYYLIKFCTIGARSISTILSNVCYRPRSCYTNHSVNIGRRKNTLIYQYISSIWTSSKSIMKRIHPMTPWPHIVNNSCYRNWMGNMVTRKLFL